MDYIILFLAVTCIAAQFCINKVYQKNFAQGLKDMFFFSVVCGTVSVIIFTLLGFFINENLFQFSAFSLIMSITLAAVSSLSVLVGILIMRYGKLSVYSTFMMLGGMILPYLYGSIFLSETVSVWRIAGLVILIFALPCSVFSPDGKSEKKEKQENKKSKIYYLLCVFIFLINGTVSIISKTHSISEFAVPATNFIVYANLWLTIINGAAYFILSRRLKNSDKQETQREIKPNKFYAVLTIAIYSTFSGLGYLFQLISAEKVDAVMLFPFVTGVTIVLSTLGARIFFKEKISKPALAGIILSICGTLMFLIKV